MGRLVSVYLLWHGRASRKTYWVYSIPIIALWAFNQYWVLKISELFYLFLFAVLIYLSAMINIKRSHDRNRTGFFTLLLLVPIVSFWPLIEFGFLAGTKGANKYGEEDAWHE